jgi:hypothetical protein
VTDSNRRRLIILAEARANATDATAVLQQLRINLDRLKGSRELASSDPRHKACQVAQELIERLIGLREWISGQISEVPS